MPSGIGATLHDTRGSVHSPNPSLADATKWIPSRKGFLGRVRFTCSRDDIVDYLTYIRDAVGCLSATLPETVATETAQITVTDQRSDPAGDGGLLLSNTVIVTSSGT